MEEKGLCPGHGTALPVNLKTDIGNFFKHGKIDVAAAQEGLELYAEHAEDAELNPGKHPNIDRLYDVIAEDSSLQVRVHPKS